ncbi:MAG: Dam family site-specific DNA-(adenine-N6)-methyltransferase [Gammaproteobacteria bacterium]
MPSTFHRAPLKWAGGKSRLLPHLLKLLPPGKQLKEPFLGSGVVFLNTTYPRYTLNDTNPHLINFYEHVKTQGPVFIDAARYYFTARTNQEKNYYKKRQQFNTSTDPLEKALLFLYLNRHGYNGLCRYNQKGEYNVPFGRYHKPYFPEKELYYFHKKAQNARFTCYDFTVTLQRCRAGDVVYCDPPYVPLTPTAYFTQYHSEGFQQQQHHTLTNHAQRLAKKGIPVLISNHHTPYTRVAYCDAQQHIIDVRRFISCQGMKRKTVKEVLALFS